MTSKMTSHVHLGQLRPCWMACGPSTLFRLFRRLAIGSPPWSQSEQPGLTNAMPTARCSLGRAVILNLSVKSAVPPPGSRTKHTAVLKNTRVYYVPRAVLRAGSRPHAALCVVDLSPLPSLLVSAASSREVGCRG